MTSKWYGRGIAAVALAVATAGIVPVLPSTPTASAQTTGLGAGGEYHPVTPQRIHDTRSGVNDVQKPGKKATSQAGVEYDVQITGKGDIPKNPDEVLAVVLNVTVADPEEQGNLAVRPAGSAAATSSLVNYLPGRNVPNLSVVGVGQDGKITVKLSTRTNSRAHVVIDVFGWVSTSAYTGANEGARLIPAGPGRIADTREGAGTPLGAGQTLAVQVRGADSFSPSVADIVPNRGSVSAVMVNITAINRQSGSRSTNIAATPTRLAAGANATSNTNAIAGLVKANMAIVPIGKDGKIYLRNFQGDVHVAVDVLGYFEIVNDDNTKGRIIPLDAPFRAFDTREAAFANAPLGSGFEEDWSFQKFAKSVRLPTANGTTTLDNQSALLGNLTGTNLQRYHPAVPITTFLSAYPGGKARPTVSNVNLPEGENVPNMSLLRYGTADIDGAGPQPADPYVVRTYNHVGSLHYILDVYAIVLK